MINYIKIYICHININILILVILYFNGNDKLKIFSQYYILVKMINQKYWLK